MIPVVAHIGEAAPRVKGRRRSLARRTADKIDAAMLEVLENDEIASLPHLMQRLDPRVKLLSILLFAVTVSLLHSISALVAMALMTMILASLSGIGAGSFARKVWASAGFFAVLIALPAVTAWISPGAVVLVLGPVSITAPGLVVATRLIVRVVAGAGIGLLVVWTTRWTDILRALTSMRVPDVLVATLAMTQKQIMSLLRTVENIHLARESRMLTTGRTGENRRWVFERMAFVATKSMKTADDVFDAMLSRGFTGAMPSLVRLKTGARDWLWIVGSVATCAAVVGLDRLVFPPVSSAFRLEGIGHEYRAGTVALQGIDLTIEMGQHVAITGANGSGKSTLLKMLDGLIFPSAGTIEALGRPLTEDALEEPDYRREFRSNVGFVFQDADVQLFCSDAFDELSFGPMQMGLPEEEVRRRVATAAEQLNITKLMDRAPYTLSGGEKKRVAIASVITMEPSVLLMDEPSNALDPRSQVWLLDVLDEWKAAGRTVVIATHDLGIAAESADRMIVLSEDHRIVADGSPEDVMAQRDLLLDVNLIHEHEHRHRAAAAAHSHAHAHAHTHSP